VCSGAASFQTRTLIRFCERDHTRLARVNPAHHDAR
jgi:hypothetical protein